MGEEVGGNSQTLSGVQAERIHDSREEHSALEVRVSWADEPTEQASVNPAERTRDRYFGINPTDKIYFLCRWNDYLGYWVGNSGIQHIPKKVETIKNMAHPTTH
jgi:hypothetical protein